MYLRTAKLRNIGPIKRFDVTFPFHGDRPKPVLLVGKNGSGKSTVISFIVNAMVGMKQHIYDDTEVEKGKVYRIRSPLAINGNAEFYFARIDFDYGVILTEWQLNRQKSDFTDQGDMQALDASWNQIPAHDASFFNLSFGELANPPRLEEMLNKNCMLFFPADRFEPPDWLNVSDLSSDLKLPEPERMKGKTSRRIFSRNRLKPTLDWLNSVIFDMMVSEHEDMTLSMAVPSSEGIQTPQDHQPIHVRVRVPGKAHTVFTSVTDVLKKVVCEKEADMLRISIGDRRSRIISAVVTRESQPFRIIKDLMSLSAGESALFCLFSSIIRDADLSGMNFASPADIEGIVVIDEADMHLHVGLQYRVLPELIALFPRVQFILSVHAPMVAIGLQTNLGGDGFEIIEMPGADRITPEAYEEFHEAFNAFSDTKAFQDRILAAATVAPGKLLVLLEGETDPKYMTAAAKLLGREDLLEKVEFQWVGAKDPRTGQGFHTGKDALNSTLTVLRANPELVKRSILLFYDNDANKADEDIGNIHVRSMPTNSGNTIVEAGIENLLHQAVITPEMFDEKTVKKKNGSKTVSTTLNKMKLCNHVCETRSDASDFQNFSPLLDIADLLAVPVTDGQAS